MKKAFLLTILALVGWAAPAFAQSPAYIRQPDCYIGFSFTASSARSAVIDNRRYDTGTPGGCTIWTMNYTNTGFTGVSIELDFANDSSGTAGSWSIWPGTSALTDTHAGTETVTGYKSWVSVATGSLTGAGVIQGNLIGWLPGTSASVSTSVPFVNYTAASGISVQTAQTAAISSPVTVATGPAGGSTWLIIENVTCDQVDTSGNATVIAAWTDSGGGSQTANAGAVCTTIGASSFKQMTVFVRLGSSAAITYTTTTAAGSGSLKYDVSVAALELSAT